MTNKQEKILGHLKERYYFEHDRKEKLNLRVQSPLTILILILGVIAFFINGSTNFGSDIIAIIFYILWGFTALCALVTGYFLRRSYYSYNYSYLPPASDFEDYIDAIKQYYKGPLFKNDSKFVIEKLKNEDIYNFLKNIYIEGIDNNIKSNNSKIKMLGITTNIITYTLLLLFSTSIPFYVKVRSIPKINKVEIINQNQGEQNMTDEQENTDQPNEPENVQPEKPKTPKIVILREGALGTSMKEVEADSSGTDTEADSSGTDTEADSSGTDTEADSSGTDTDTSETDE